MVCHKWKFLNKTLQKGFETNINAANAFGSNFVFQTSNHRNVFKSIKLIK